MSPCFILSISLGEKMTFAGPTPTPGEAGEPVRIGNRLSAKSVDPELFPSSRFVRTPADLTCFMVVIGRDCTIYVLPFSIAHSISCGKRENVYCTVASNNYHKT